MEHLKGSQDSSLSIVTAWMAEVQFLAGAREFSLLHNIQTSYEAKTA
jgi:hypothetical protein